MKNSFNKKATLVKEDFVGQFIDQFESFKTERKHLFLKLLINLILIPTIISMSPILGFLISLMFIYDLRKTWINYRFEKAMLFMSGEGLPQEITQKYYSRLTNFW